VSEQQESVSKKDPNNWVARLGTVGTRLLEPFTSEATRKEGRQLVLVSALTILLSVNIIKVIEGNLAGLKFESPSIEWMVILAGLACVYLLVLYGLDLWRDGRTGKYKRMSSIVEYLTLRDEVVLEINAKTQKHYELLMGSETFEQFRKELDIPSNDKKLDAKAAALESIMKTTYRLIVAHFITEIVIPLGLGLFAVTLAILHFFH
jgi:hypothetical protein